MGTLVGTRAVRAPVAAALAVAAAAAGACGGSPPPASDWERLPQPPTDRVERVVFLVGDAGAALPGRSPTLARLQNEVELWSNTLARDSAVAVVYLGDLIYPDGLHERGHPDYPADSAHLASQIEVVAGPAARRHRSPGFFIAGNHDWGNRPGDEGLGRLRNIEDALAALREGGLAVDLVPEAGRSGPEVVDLGDRVRFLFMDTHWWLQNRHPALEDSVFGAVARALRTADGREVVLAAHHPFRSGGSHGGPVPFWEGLGIVFLLRQTGSLIQDLNSVPYRELLEGLEEVFLEEARPLLWAGGHDHSLQVLRGVDDRHPLWSVVSGSGSKLTDVVGTEGMLYGSDRPGYMRLTFLRGGTVLLHVTSAPDTWLSCKEEDDVEDTEECMREGVAAFETTYAVRLR